MPETLRAIDLFCGAGGLSEGFRQAGFEIVGGVDNDATATDSFARNFPGAFTICRDIREVSSQELTKSGNIDVLLGGPSCQGFSTHGKRIADDPRNFLYREYLRVVSDLLPNWVVMENVRGMLWYSKGLFKKQIFEEFERLGYEVQCKTLLAADYGVPQLRERVIFIATRTGLPIVYPKPSHGLQREHPWTTVRDAISDLPALGLEGGEIETAYPSNSQSEYQQAMRADSVRLTYHQARRLSPKNLALATRIPQGTGIRAIPFEDLPERFRKMRTIANGNLRRDCTTLYHRLSWDKPSYTITCYFRNISSGPFLHPEDHRALTCREAARLQSFPDHFYFKPVSVPRQIGNAVPPLLGRAIAETILQAIAGELNASNIVDEPKQLVLL